MPRLPSPHLTLLFLAIAATTALPACIPPMEAPDIPDNPFLDYDGDCACEEEPCEASINANCGDELTGGDCNDLEITVHPDADEICDGLDNDCNDIVDDNPVDIVTWTLDVDGDGYGKDSTATEACIAPSEQYVSQGGDCDDTLPGGVGVNPGAQEVCDGGTDEDCDGLIDHDDDSVSGQETWYEDRDGDGYGASTPNAPIQACEQPACDWAGGRTRTATMRTP